MYSESELLDEDIIPSSKTHLAGEELKFPMLKPLIIYEEVS